MRVYISLMSDVSAVRRGQMFEQRSLNILHSQLSMSLKRVGGARDGGIDLQGWWWLPDQHLPATGVSGSEIRERRIRVLGQCKAEKKKMGPNYVREMEGVLGRFPQPAVALLISQSAFTKATLLRAVSSPLPFFLLHLPAEEDAEGGEVGAAVWNPALGGVDGLLGGEAEMRWERSSDTLALDPGRPGLWWKGKRLKSWIPDNDVVDGSDPSLD